MPEEKLNRALADLETWRFGGTARNSLSLGNHGGCYMLLHCKKWSNLGLSWMTP